MKKSLLFLASSAIVFALMLLVWQAIIWIFAVPKYMLPSPLLVAQSTIARIGDISSALLITSEEAICGMLASIVIGVLIALVFARSNSIRRLLFPYTILLQTVPIIAVTPIIIMWIGPGLLAVTLIVFVFCVPSVIANTTQGLISVDESLVQLFLMHNASESQILQKLRLPHSVPNLFVAIRISTGLAVIGAITGELFAGSSRVGQGGLGYSIVYAQSQVQTDYLFALVLAATLLGFVFFFTAMFFEWLLLHKWHESATPRNN
jgi:NitT/TauT family transport system permease protein